MILDDASYFTRRALFQFEQASVTDDDTVARVHVQLSDLYLERARQVVSEQTSSSPRDNVVPLRAVP